MLVATPNSLLIYNPPIPRGDGITHSYVTISASEALTTGAETRDLTLNDDPSSQPFVAPPYDSDLATPINPRQQLTVWAAPPPFNTTLDLLKLPLAANCHAKLDPPKVFELPKAFHPSLGLSPCIEDVPVIVTKMRRQ
ncbi:unnamed protein product [Penicillium glandicola]